MTGPNLPDEIKLVVESHVAQVWLNRPEKYNALTRNMLDGLVEAVRWAAVSKDVRSIALLGNGDMFCAGDDLDGLGSVHGEGPSAETEVYDGYAPLVVRLLTIRKPVVAAVHGGAFVAGLDIALAADYRVAAADAKLGPVSASLGIAGGTALLPLYVSVGTARRLLLRAKPIRGEEALGLGLVDELVDAAVVKERAIEVAREFAQGPTLAYGAVKSALLAGIGVNPVAVLNMEQDYSMSGYQTPDYREAVAAWQERREPRFTGSWSEASK